MCTCPKLNHFAFRTLLKTHREIDATSKLFCNSLTIQFILRILQKTPFTFLYSIYLWNSRNIKWCGQFHPFSGIQLLFQYLNWYLYRIRFTVFQALTLLSRSLPLLLLSVYQLVQPHNFIRIFLKGFEIYISFLPKKPKTSACQFVTETIRGRIEKDNIILYTFLSPSYIYVLP